MEANAGQVIGVLGGSGLYDIAGLTDVEEVRLDTPFGEPSDAYVTGVLEGRTLVFLPRHGRGHRISPSEVNYRANIHGFKQLGAQWLISISAVGSMREEIKPGDVVIVDQLFDRTRDRPRTFFGDGIVGHIEFADPMCPDLSRLLGEVAREAGARVHEGGTYICIEGPQFSTRAESRIYRSWGVDVIGMTNIPEAKLAREAGLCYATVAMSTDYDCWHEAEDDVSVEAIVQQLQRNAELARQIIRQAALRIPTRRSCRCADAVKNAVITSPDAMDPATREKLRLILGEE
jgi:5'-methylthioadenosine phosphorylase